MWSVFESMDIDFVMPWVDGSDPNWQAEKAKYQEKTLDDSNSANRFRDWGLLPYWFRAVEKFTPWVRKIHFITWGHLPAFLNTENPKLHIVRHEDYLPVDVLPTFSSHAIEMNIHRIPGLAEHFVYFNDDTFLIRAMPQTSFFYNGVPCTYGGEYPIELVGNIEIWQHAAVNDLGVINKHFNKQEQVKKYRAKYANRAYRWQNNLRTKFAERLFPNYFIGFENLHAPAAYCKRTFEAIWNAEPKLLKSTTAHRFRSAGDVNQWLALWWQIASGDFYPYRVDNLVDDVTESSIDQLCEVIKSQKHDMICLNDPSGDIDFERMTTKLKASFQEILPNKSQFER